MKIHAGMQIQAFEEGDVEWELHDTNKMLNTYMPTQPKVMTFVSIPKHTNKTNITNLVFPGAVNKRSSTNYHVERHHGCSSDFIVQEIHQALTLRIPNRSGST
jgi:hypothetical protein